MPNAPGLTLRSYGQFGLEATWASAATVNRKFGFESETFECNVGLAEDPNLPGNAGYMVADIVPTIEKAEGEFSMVADFEGQMRWLDLAFGTATFGTYGAAVSGSNPYTHIFTPKEFFNSITAELGKGNIAAGKIQQLLGMKAKGFSLKGTAAPGEQNFLRLTVPMLGQQMVVDQNPTGALTIVPRIPILMKHATTIVDGSGDAAADVRVIDFSFDYNNGAVERNFAGLSFTDEPLRGGYVVAVMKWVREYRTNTFITAYKAGTNIAPAITFADGNGRSLKIELERAKVMKCTQNPSGVGLMRQEIELKGTFAATSTFGAKVTAINTQAAAAV